MNILTVYMRFLILLLLSLALFQTQLVYAQNPNDRNYDPYLDDLIEAEDPSEVADSKGLNYKNGSVLLVIEIQDDERLPEKYGLETVQKYSKENVTLVEVYIDIDNIRDLANDSSVDYIRPPSQPVAVSQSTGNGSSDSTENENTSNTTLNTSESQETNGFTAAVAVLSVAVFILYARWS